MNCSSNRRRRNRRSGSWNNRSSRERKKQRCRMQTFRFKKNRRTCQVEVNNKIIIIKVTKIVRANSTNTNHQSNSRRKRNIMRGEGTLNYSMDRRNGRSHRRDQAAWILMKFTLRSPSFDCRISQLHRTVIHPPVPPVRRLQLFLVWLQKKKSSSVLSKKYARITSGFDTSQRPSSTSNRRLRT